MIKVAPTVPWCYHPIPALQTFQLRPSINKCLFELICLSMITPISRRYIIFVKFLTEKYLPFVSRYMHAIVLSTFSRNIYYNSEYIRIVLYIKNLNLLIFTLEPRKANDKRRKNDCYVFISLFAFYH